MSDATTRRRRAARRPSWRALLAVAAVLLLAGCAGSPLGGTDDAAAPPAASPSPPPSASGPPLRACTEIGCVSSLTFRSDRLAAVLGQRRDLSVTACLDGRCSQHRIASGRCAGTGWGLDEALECHERSLILQLRDTADLGARAHTARLRVAAGGRVLLDERAGGIRFTRMQPNGPGCEPVCWVALVRLP